MKSQVKHEIEERGQWNYWPHEIETSWLWLQSCCPHSA